MIIYKIKYKALCMQSALMSMLKSENFYKTVIAMIF